MGTQNITNKRNMNRKRFVLKAVSIVLAFTILSQSLIPTSLLALTSGPGSPEFSSFTPVAMNEMVNTFTGSFAYNIPIIDIPGPEGSGYAMSLAYDQGAGMETEASWVGFGWNLSPGAINRNKRGFADELNGEKVHFYNKTRPNWSVGKTFTVIPEREAPLEPTNYVGVKFNASHTSGFNNYSGFSENIGVGVGNALGAFNVNLTASNITFDLSLNVLSILSALKSIKLKKKKENDDNQSSGEQIDQNLNTKDGDGSNGEENLPQSGLLFNKLAQDITTISVDFALYPNSPAPSRKMTGTNYTESYSAQLDDVLPDHGIEKGLYNRFFSYRKSDYHDYKEVYGYKNYVNNEGEGVSDFYMEKDNDTYKRTDDYLGIPFNNYDIYNVNAEGISGAFRYYHKKIANHKNDEFSTLIKYRGVNIENDASAAYVGVGFNLQPGIHRITSRTWCEEALSPDAESGFYRFIGDKGGSIEYEGRIVNSIEQEKGERDGNNVISPQFEEVHAKYNNTIPPASAYIDGADDNTEFKIVNPNGYTYNFSQPVYTRNETSLSVSVDGYRNVENGKIKSSRVYRNIPLTRGTDGKIELNDEDLATINPTVVGTIDDNETVSSNLLTSILSPNYIDSDGNTGVTEGDYGGWTTFGYRKRACDYNTAISNGYYRYRMPYHGLFYNQGSVSDPKDDLGSFSTGEKEVYYLGAVETKTHVAFFVTNKSTQTTLSNASSYATEIEDANYITGSGNDRLDGYGASDLYEEENSKGDKNSETRNTAKEEGQQLEYLEKIVLFSKKRLDKPIKTIRFDYSYEAFNGIPNNSEFQIQGSAINSGKLTLKRVWFEYDGAYPMSISPYEFKYEYKKVREGQLGYEYFREMDKYGEQESHAYDPDCLDPWGYPRKFAKERGKYGIPWIYQGFSAIQQYQQSKNSWKSSVQPQELNSYYDPALYNLKQIRLPSGGEIHIQYEEHDYQYVQNRKPMTMVSLLKYDYIHKEVFVNCEDVGIIPSGDTKEEGLLDRYVDTLKTYLSDEQMYFKFLFSLNSYEASLDNKNSEFIDGYTSINVDGITRDNINGKNCIKIPLKRDTKNDGEFTNTPKSALYNFFINNRVGKVNSLGIEPNNEARYDNSVVSVCQKLDAEEPLAGIEMRELAIEIMKKGIYESTLAVAYNRFTPSPVEESNSFVKLPVFYPKKGGGARVKRVLFVDSGVEPGDGGVYGQEYIYGENPITIDVDDDEEENDVDDITINSISWGVANNEPAGFGSESALVELLGSKRQGIVSRLFAGRDKEQKEGPLGESLLPGPSIGYERVIVKNIQSKKSTLGYTVYSYSTSKKYYFDKFYDYGDDNNFELQGKATDYTKLEKGSPGLPLGAIEVDINHKAQAFRFVKVNRHGVLEKVERFDGTPNDGKQDNCISYSRNIYFEPGQKVPVWDGAENQVEMTIPGKEMDIAEFGKKNTDRVFKIPFELDVWLVTETLIPGFNVQPSIQIKDVVVAKHSVSKYISYPVILKAVETMSDNIVSTQENLVFCEQTGEPIITRTFDAYHGKNIGGAVHNGSVYSINYPAMWKYPYFRTISEGGSNQINQKLATIAAYGDVVMQIDAGTGEEVLNFSWFNNPTNVFAASVVEFSNDVSYITDKYRSTYPISAGTEAKLGDMYRPKATYTYLPASYNSNSYLFEKGTFNIPSGEMFDITPGNDLFPTNSNNTAYGWIKQSEVTSFTPGGLPMEEEDALKMKSAVLYGESYGRLLPTMVATNASYGELFFNDYEGNNTNCVADADAHSGAKIFSKVTEYNKWEALSGTIYADYELKKSGGDLYFWTKNSLGEMRVRISPSAVKKVEYVARSGNWILGKAHFEPEEFQDENTLEMKIASSATSQVSLILDDVRFQPTNCNATCFVYDIGTFKQLAVFDSHHFGVYYQYDGDGSLTTKRIESQKYGKTTVQESQTAMPVKDRQ